jgi:iron transport multicopper oxidase
MCQLAATTLTFLADSALMYFTHNGQYLPPKQGTISNPAHVGFNQNATINFQPGKTYRLRIVNTSAFATFVFFIDGHDMRTIEVDGVKRVLLAVSEFGY